MLPPAASLSPAQQSPAPLVATAASLLIAGGLYAHTTKIVAELRREVASLHTVASSSRQIAASAETAASRAAVSFQSLSSTLRRDRIEDVVSGDAASRAAEEAGERVAREVLAPVATTVARMSATIESQTGALEEAFTRLENVVSRLTALESRLKTAEKSHPAAAAVFAPQPAAAHASPSEIYVSSE